MVVENLMKRERIGDRNQIYYYKITKSNIEMDGTFLPYELQTYGIEIERHDMVDDKLVNVEKNSIKSISPHRFKVDKLLKLLYDNTVSPIHLIDIAEEYVDSFSYDYDLRAI